MFGRRNSTRNRRKEATGKPSWLAAINWRRLLPAGAVMLAMAVGWYGLRLALDQPVERLNISGRFQRVQALEIQKAVRTALGRKGMISVDLDAVGRAVQELQWVDRASVARSWPRGLSIQVFEQQPVARWGGTGLLNARGEVFVRESHHLPAELPEFTGPEGSEIAMTERYLAMQPQLTEAGLRLQRLLLDERGAWEIELDNGVSVRLGRAPVDRALVVDERFERFIVAAARLVASRSTEIRYVDMRYASGFAIGWRTAAGEVWRG
jgi:cell division protein FtsQ